MRILHLLGQHPAKTGSGISMQAAIRELHRLEHPQFAVYGLNSTHKPVDVGCPSSAVIFSREKDGQPLFGMSDVMPYDSFRFCDMTVSQYRLWAGRFLDETRRAITRFQPDVILGHHLHLYTALIAKHTQVPVVGVCHGTDLAQLERNPAHRTHVQKAFRKVPLVLTNSPSQHADVVRLLDYPQAQLRVLGGGFDPSVFYPGEPPAPPPFEIVYTGKISEHKGLRPLYHALAHLPKDSFRLTVAGAGEGEETRRLVQLGDALDLPIHYAGFLSQTELAELYRRVHLFVLPSYEEGLSLATLEALGAGLSCVVMDWPNLKAYLPKEFEQSGQIRYVKRIAEHPVDESHPAFETLVAALADAIESQRVKMFSSGSFSGIVSMDAISWAGRIERLALWLTRMLRIENREETSMSKHLFIPGPVDVSEDVLEKMATQQIGHRTKAATELQKNVSEKLQKVFYTNNRIIVSTSSGSGLMEGAIRSFTKKKAAVFSIGSFGDRWYKMATANGVPADVFKVTPGEPTKVEDVDEALATGEYDVITVTHNETSSGVMNDVEAIGKLLKDKYPDVLLLVDAVSSMGGVKIDVDGWGIDCCITSTQKCLGLPAGMAFASVSERAYERAKTVENRGLYFDMVSLYDFVRDKPYQYPSTPSLAHLFATDYQLDKILEEGLENRFDRHLQMAKRVRAWAKEHFDLLVKDEKYMSQTLTTIVNTKGISVSDLNKKLAQYGMALSNGYGDLKEKTFRISHMADYTMEDIDELLKNIDTILEEQA